MDKERKCVLIDRWNYHKPSFDKNKDGEIIFLFKCSFGPCEWEQWGINAAGKPFHEYRWCENDFYEDESFVMEVTAAELLKALESAKKFYIEHGFSEYGMLCERAAVYVAENF